MLHLGMWLSSMLQMHMHKKGQYPCAFVCCEAYNL